MTYVEILVLKESYNFFSFFLLISVKCFFFFLRASRDHFLEKLAPDDDRDSYFVESISSRPNNKRSIKVGKALPMGSLVSGQ